MSEPTANQTSGEKALRIGVIQGVRVIEERILRGREPVTFGTGPGNTFSFASSDLPKSIKVFDVKDGAYVLLLQETTAGRLEEGTGRKDFAQLRASTSAVNGEWRVPVGENGKGRIRLSPEITVLFHFVVPPPVVQATPIPEEMRGGLLKAFEPIFTAVLTASFLVHLLIGIYVRVTEPPEHSDVDDFKELVERIQPPRVEVKPPPVQNTPKTDTASTTGTGPAETPPKKGDSSGGGEDSGGASKSSGSGKGSGGNGGAGDRAAIREGIAGKGILQLIGGRGGGGGGAVGSVFGAGSGISDDIGGALAGTAGVGIAGGAGGGDGVTRRGTGGGGGGGDGSGGEGGGALGIGELKAGGGGGGGGSIDTGAKTATKVVARVRADDIETVDGRIDKKSVAATIRRRQDGFQGCYETALKSNSKLGGKLVVEFTIAEGGKVTSARVINDGLNSGEVSNCVLALLKRLRFPEPSDGEVAITNAFVFQPGG